MPYVLDSICMAEFQYSVVQKKCYLTLRKSWVYSENADILTSAGATWL